MGYVDSTAAGILYNCIGNRVMVTTFGNSIHSAFTYGFPVKEIYCNGVLVWPLSNSFYYIKWTPTSISGPFLMNSGQTMYLEDYDGFYSGPFYIDPVEPSYSSYVSRCEIDTSAFQSNSEIVTVVTNCEEINAGAFAYCPSLIYAHAKCYRLWNGAFVGCSSLFSVELPNCSYISWKAFQSCTNLTYVSIPKCEFLGFEVFCDCKALDNLYLPDCSYIYDNAFMGCTNLTTITFGYSGIVSFGGNMFSNTPIGSLSGRIYVPRDWLASYKERYPYYSTIFYQIPN